MEGGNSLSKQTENKALNFKVPIDLYEKLVNEANNKNISLAAIVRVICSEYFNNKDNSQK